MRTFSGKECALLAVVGALHGFLLMAIPVSMLWPDADPSRGLQTPSEWARDLIDAHYRYTEQGVATNDTSFQIHHLEYTTLDHGTQTGDALLIVHTPPRSIRLGSEEDMIDVFLFTPTGPTNIFHQSVFSFGVFLTTRFVKLPEPHLAIATIQGSGGFLDLELHAWDSEQGYFTNTYTIQDAPHATVTLSERHIHYAIYGQAYEVKRNAGEYRANPVAPKASFAIPRP